MDTKLKGGGGLFRLPFLKERGKIRIRIFFGRRSFNSNIRIQARIKKERICTSCMTKMDKRHKSCMTKMNKCQKHNKTVWVCQSCNNTNSLFHGSFFEVSINVQVLSN